MRRNLVLAAVLVIFGAGASGAIWVRVAPLHPERWHVDPLAADAPGDNGWLVRDGADASSPRFDMPAGELLRRIDAIAMAEPRTRRISGSVEEGRITYETRSRFWGFPDYTTVTVVEEPGGSAPVLLARSRYGASDLGVNRARVEEWLAALEQSLPA